jgi:hypothetical protein
MGNKNTKLYKLEGKPWTLDVMKALALTTKTHEQLAEEYGCTRECISRFRKRHEQQIADIRARATEEFAGILISQKANRLAMYESAILAAVDEGDRKSIIRILRNVAEEMGHLPSRMQISGAVDVHTSYSMLDGDGNPIDMSKLR